MSTPSNDEPKVVIRAAGATPHGVRTSAGAAPAQASAAQAAARFGLPATAAAKPAAGAKPAARKAKGKQRKPAAARQPLTQRLRARMQGMRFRLLPVTIFVAVLMLGIRVGDLWHLVTRDARLPDFPVTLAQGPQGTQNPPAGPTAKPKDAPPPKEAGNKPPPPAQGGASANPAAPVTAAVPEPLGPISNEELLQHFAERRAEIERRTKELEQREALLAAAEKRIDQKVAEMEKTRADIQKMMRQGDEKQAAQLESLVKIYETMKPKEAARIFEEMEMTVLLDVIQRMKETKTAPILAAMDPAKATAVTTALIERRGVPSGK
ncbi:MotE family protein [Azospirillum thermophilum]|uniref:Magnesium transporter MgtE intracellular domain-containing protein n=1 Tax=Azospirillum thermophilum TaxID=2202148 RepID=A0A2S2CQT0_9PROT|nr:hypothetical protein [Azospirillum thermophilum]AWK86809.1 hypothetical protein DEW08_11685 [Azospirillum thermophilum]